MVRVSRYHRTFRCCRVRRAIRVKRACRPRRRHRGRRPPSLGRPVPGLPVSWPIWSSASRTHSLIRYLKKKTNKQTKLTTLIYDYNRDEKILDGCRARLLQVCIYPISSGRTTVETRIRKNRLKTLLDEDNSRPETVCPLGLQKTAQACFIRSSSRGVAFLSTSACENGLSARLPATWKICKIPLPGN